MLLAPRPRCSPLPPPREAELKVSGGTCRASKPAQQTAGIVSSYQHSRAVDLGESRLCGVAPSSAAELPTHSRPNTPAQHSRPSRHPHLRLLGSAPRPPRAWCWHLAAPRKCCRPCWCRAAAPGCQTLLPLLLRRRRPPAGPRPPLAAPAVVAACWRWHGAASYRCGVLGCSPYAPASAPSRRLCRRRQCCRLCQQQCRRLLRGCPCLASTPALPCSKWSSSSQLW
jgi:hypothetical protein